MSPRAKLQELWNQKVESGMAPLTITPKDPPADCVLLRPATPCSAEEEILVWEADSTPPGNAGGVPPRSWLRAEGCGYDFIVKTGQNRKLN